MANYVVVEAKIEIPVNATQVQIENWIFNRLNVTSSPLDEGNPLDDVALEATSVHDIIVSDLHQNS